MDREHRSQQPLTIDFITSLDGYASAVGWPGLWGVNSAGYSAFIQEHLDDPDTVIMGGATYRVMSGFAASGEEADAMDFMARIPKIVFSSKVQEPLAWPNTRVIGTDAVEAVRRLKGEGSTPLRTLGSLLLCRSLLRAGPVDRFRVVVFPYITGETGRENIYDGYPDVSLELVDSRTFDRGVQLLEYIPTLIDGPPTDDRP